MENVLVLPFFLFALMIFLSLAFDLICHVVAIALAVVEWATEARRRKAMELPVTVSGSGAKPERTVTVQGEGRRVIPIEGREVHSALPGRRGDGASVEGPDDEDREDRILQAALDSLGLQITLWGSFWTCFDVEEICLENPDDEEAIAKMVEYFRADGAEEERWHGPDPNQFYWDASRRFAVTQGNCIEGDRHVKGFYPDLEGTALYIDVGVVEDAEVTWHGLWVRTYCWDRLLETQQLTLTVDGEPTRLELRQPGWYIDHSDRYRGPVFEERSIFNAPPGLLRKIARARSVGVRLEGQHQVIEKRYTRRNIACVRKFVRDRLEGEKLRQDA
jgi:hypothetical protein